MHIMRQMLITGMSSSFNHFRVDYYEGDQNRPSHKRNNDIEDSNFNYDFKKKPFKFNNHNNYRGRYNNYSDYYENKKMYKNYEHYEGNF